MKFKKVLETTLSEMAQQHIDFLTLNLLKQGEIEKAAQRYKERGPKAGAKRTIRNAKERHSDIPGEAWDKFLNAILGSDQSNQKKEAVGDDKKLTPTEKEDWFDENTNLKTKRGEGKIKVEHEGKNFSLPDFLKTGLNQFFALDITKEEPSTPNEIRVSASFESKQDLILPESGQIYLKDSPEKRTSQSFPSGAAFEFKDYAKKDLQGKYIFQIARIANFGQVINILKNNLEEDAVMLEFEDGKELVSLEELRVKTVSKKTEREEKTAYRNALKKFLERPDIKNKLFSKIVGYIKGGGEGPDFFENISNFLNQTKKTAVKIPDNLYIVTVGGPDFATGNKIKQNFKKLDERIIPLKHENIYFTPEKGRITFHHVEAQFTFNESKEYNSLARDIIAISEFTEKKDYSKKYASELLASLPGASEEDSGVMFNIEIHLGISLTVNIAQ